MCALYGSWIQWLIVTGATLMDDHYKTDIISCAGHLRSNSVIMLVLCKVAFNIRGTDVVLQVLWDSTNPIKNG